MIHELNPDPSDKSKQLLPLFTDKETLDDIVNEVRRRRGSQLLGL